MSRRHLPCMRRGAWAGRSLGPHGCAGGGVARPSTSLYYNDVPVRFVGQGGGGHGMVTMARSAGSRSWTRLRTGLGVHPRTDGRRLDNRRAALEDAEVRVDTLRNMLRRTAPHLLDQQPNGRARDLLAAGVHRGPVSYTHLRAHETRH